MTERALAELETEANAVLARLTDGRMGLRLETQREKKTGGVAETLDVVLTDGGEPRPYDSFSGGEAFRADFSLRLGLSKLLARRAGVRRRAAAFPRNRRRLRDPGRRRPYGAR
jgi:exonuclease SbcC